MRDPGLYLESFLRHYRALGAAHFVFLDNGSTDGALEKLLHEPDTTILECRLPFGRHENAMRNYLLATYGRDRWSAMVDIDEFLDYPDRAHRPLTSVLAELDREGFNAVLTPMLDLFPEGPIRKGRGANFQTTHRRYELSSARFGPYPGRSNRLDPRRVFEIVRGGPRGRLFGIPELLLTKHSLLRFDDRMVRTDPHWLHGARISAFPAVLLHYKFADFAMHEAAVRARSDRQLASREELAACVRKLQREPGLELEGSRLENVDELQSSRLLGGPAQENNARST